MQLFLRFYGIRYDHRELIATTKRNVTLYKKKVRSKSRLDSKCIQAIHTCRISHNQLLTKVKDLLAVWFPQFTNLFSKSRRCWIHQADNGGSVSPSVSAGLMIVPRGTPETTFRGHEEHLSADLGKWQ